MEVKVVWKDMLGFEAVTQKGISIPLEGDREAENSLLPMELIALGLAGCTAMDTISILQKKRQDVTAFEVLVHAERAEEHPRVFTQILLDYVITGRQIDPVAVERAVQLSEEKYCPAQAMLRETVKIEHKITIQEEEAKKLAQ